MQKATIEQLSKYIESKPLFQPDAEVQSQGKKSRQKGQSIDRKVKSF